MNAIKHKECFGTIFPKQIGVGEQAGKVFSVRIDAPPGMMRARPNTQTDIGQWDDCQQCPEFESCYALCLAKLALQTAVTTNY